MSTGPQRIRQDIARVGIALVVSSLLGFLLLGVVARWLPPDDNAAFLSIWGIVFGFGSVISASEQEIARYATHAKLEGAPVPAAVAQYALTGLVGSALALGVILAFPWGTAVFRGSAVSVLLTLLAVGGFAIQFMARGVFVGTGQISRYVVVILLESVLRVVFAGALLFMGALPSLPLAVAAIVVGSFGWIPVIRPLLRSVNWRSDLSPWRKVLERIGMLSLANGLSALVLTAFPTLVTALMGSSRGLAVLFGVVTVSRVPLVMASPLQAMAVPLAVRALREGKGHLLSRLQVSLGLGAAAVAALVGIAGYFLGPWGMRLFMGPQYDAPGLMVGLMLAAGCFVTAALLQAAVLVALERHHLVVATWAFSVGLAVLTLFAYPGDAEQKGMWSFVVASLGAYMISTILLRAPLRSRGVKGNHT